MCLIDRKPQRGTRLVLAALPFGLVLAGYAIASAARLSANANDKLLPGFASLVEALRRFGFVADPRSDVYLLWDDTLTSLARWLSAFGIATVLALVVGLLMGMLPFVRVLISSFVGVVAFERERFGATITRDIELWPKRVAGQTPVPRPAGDVVSRPAGHPQTAQTAEIVA